MKKAIAKQEESEYNEILQQAVAVINETRIKVARQLNIGENAVYWKIGQMLHERKLESKHGNAVVTSVFAKACQKCNKLLHFYHGGIFCN